MTIIPSMNALQAGLLKNPHRSPFPRPNTNPPYPPLTGGYKKAMRPRRAEGALLFLASCQRGLFCLYPSVKGG